MEVFTGASHHDILLLIIQISVLLLAARVLGEVAQRLGQPAVVGELLAGIILGPSLLSGFFPALGDWLVPHTAVQGYLLELISMLGAMFLLIITGLETDIPLIKRHGKKAFGIAAGGLLLPFLSGFLLAHYLPDSLVADPNARLVFNLFIATAMAISSIPVIAKVLMDLNLMRRDLGQTILASGMIDDTTAWILLSIILGIASGEAITVGTVFYAIIKIIAFFVLSFTAGRWLVKKGLHFAQDRMQSRDIILTFVIVVAFLFGAVAQAIQVEAVLGAFVAGIIFGTMPRLPNEVIHKLESIALGIFAPIFFAVSGLKVDIISLMRPELLLVVGVVISIAILGKLIGAYSGARLVGLDHWSSLAYGSALNARGAVEIIIATIGLSMGILTQDMYSIIVLMAMVTSLMAPSLLKWTVGKMKIGKEEQERLKKEEMAAESLVAGIHRVLLPVRPLVKEAPDKSSEDRRRVESKILEMFGKNNPISITLFTVAPKENYDRSKAYLEDIAAMFDKIEVETKVIEAENPGKAILNEAQKYYDLLVLGAIKRNSNQSLLFNPMIDDLIRLAPCPTIVVQANAPGKDWTPSKVLVPTNGSEAAKNAAELSFYIGDAAVYETIILHAVKKRTFASWFYNYKSDEHLKAVGQSILDRHIKQADALHKKATTILKEGKSTEKVILSVSKQNSVDLIIIGTNVHPGTERLYLGPRVENVLNTAQCPVLIFNT